MIAILALPFPALLAVSPPEDFAAKRRAREEICRAAEEAGDLVEELASEHRAIPWTLLPDAYREMAAQADSSQILTIYPIVEALGPESAALWAVVSFRTGEGLEAPFPYCFRFTRSGAAWCAADGVPRPFLLGDPAVRVRRADGIALERWPAFLRSAVNEQPERFRHALEAGDGAACAAIVEEVMRGFSPDRLEEVFRRLAAREAEPPIEIARIRRQKAEGETVRLELDLYAGGRWTAASAVLTKQGEGWLLTEEPESREKRTMMDVRALATAVEAYAVDHEVYPAAPSLDALRLLLEPTYIATAPASDAWGNAFEYTVFDGGKSYRIRSAGADGAFQPVGSWRPGKIEDGSPADLVYADGEFVTWWELSPR